MTGTRVWATYLWSLHSSAMTGSRTRNPRVWCCSIVPPRHLWKRGEIVFVCMLQHWIGACSSCRSEIALSHLAITSVCLTSWLLSRRRIRWHWCSCSNRLMHWTNPGVETVPCLVTLRPLCKIFLAALRLTQNFRWTKLARFFYIFWLRLCILVQSDSATWFVFDSSEFI